jgi:hypothetical protein
VCSPHDLKINPAQILLEAADGFSATKRCLYATSVAESGPPEIKMSTNKNLNAGLRKIQ